MPVDACINYNYYFFWLFLSWTESTQIVNIQNTIKKWVWVLFARILKITLNYIIFFQLALINIFSMHSVIKIHIKFY